MDEAAAEPPRRKTRGRLSKEQLEQIRSAIQVYIDHGRRPVWAQISRALNMFDSNDNLVLGRRIEDLWYSTLCPESVMKRGDPTHDEYMALRATMNQTSGYGKMVPGRTAQWVANTRRTSGFKDFCIQQDILEKQQMTNGILPNPSESVQRLENALNIGAKGQGLPYAFSPERYNEYEAFVQKEDIPAAESVPRSGYAYAPPFTPSPFRVEGVEGVEANFFDQSPGSANTGFSEFGPFSSSVGPSEFSGGKAYKKSRKSSRKARKSSRKAHKKSSRKLFRKARKSSRK
jgi:hypothetical protein